MSSKKTIAKADIDEIIKKKSMDLKSPNLKNLNFSRYPSYKLNSPIKKYLPYTLNSKLFSKFALVFLVSLVFQNSSKAFTFKAPKHNASKIKSRQTEATTCTDCLTRSPQSSLSEYLSQLPIVKDGFARVYDAAYFDDGNDKHAVVELRKRKANGETLTAEENAILQAASRTGLISFCDNKKVANAFLVNINGRDAIITSAHSLINPKTGKHDCDINDVSYFPNISFYDSSSNKKPNDFEKKLVKTDGTTPLNFENILGQKNGINPDQDFLIFFLKDQKKPLSKETLPDGTTRGFISFNPTPQGKGELYMLGIDPNFKDGFTSAFQKCNYRSIGEGTLFHSCDTKKGTSSSLLATKNENNELEFSGIHIIGKEETKPLPEIYTNWNQGTSSKNVSNFLSDENLTN